MPPSRGSKSLNVVFTYKGRKATFARPATFEVKRCPLFIAPHARLRQNSFQDALSIAKKKFTPLKALPPERIYISACLPDHEEEGVVEISPEVWQLATKDVKQFTVGIIDEDVKVEELEGAKKEKEEEVAAPMPLQPLRPLRICTPPPRASGSTAPRIYEPRNQGFWVAVVPVTDTRKTDYIIDLDPSDNILNLKLKYQDVSGIPPDHQRMIFRGKQLEDDWTLADCSIVTGAVLHMILRLRGGKPVIYLYPPTSINAKVSLSLVPQWSFSAVYPHPIKGSFKEGKSSQTAQWDVIAQPNGMMTLQGSSAEVAYIFWEAETESHDDLPESPPLSRSPSPLLRGRGERLCPRVGFVPGTTKCSPDDSVVLSVQDLPPYLEKALLALGLHTEARTSFITYWLPSFLKHEHLALRFVPQIDYEASAPLDIDPKPDVVTRVFMLFQGISTERLVEWEEARQRSLADVSMWKGIVGVEDGRQSDQSLFRVLEWGGMEVR